MPTWAYLSILVGLILFLTIIAWPRHRDDE
jgi:hypothetical protein